MDGFHSPGSADGVDAAGQAASAGKLRNISIAQGVLLLHERPVSPFAFRAAETPHQIPATDLTSADAGAEDNRKDIIETAAGAEMGFGECKTIGVVFHADTMLQGRTDTPADLPCKFRCKIRPRELRQLRGVHGPRT